MSLVALLAIAVGGVGCDRPTAGGDTRPTSGVTEQSEPESSSRAAEPPTDGDALPDVDIERSGELPEQPERIVSLAPNVTETLFALGLGDRVVGRTKFCDYPDRATEIPSVGSFVNPDYERILAQEPDLIVGVISGGPRDIYEKLAGSEIPYVFIRMTTLKQTTAGIRHLGRFVGRSERADRLVEEMRREMTRVEGRWQSRSQSRPRVLLVYGHDPIVAAGSGTFGHQLLTRLGARNVLGDAESKYPRLDAEKLVELKPERILDTAADDAEAGRDFWSGYDMVDAARDGRVAFLPDPVVLRPGPRLPEALRRMARAVYGRDRAAGDAGGAVR